MDMYEDALGISKKLQKTPEFIELREAYKKIKENPKSFRLFQKFQRLQMKFGQKQMQGQTLTEEDFEKMNQLNERIQKSKSISNFMEKNQEVVNIINEISSIITQPIQEFYED